MASFCKRRRLRSSAWDFFIPSPDRLSAKCKICEHGTVIRTTNGSTTGLHTHLRLKHSVIVEEDIDLDESVQEMNLQVAICKLAALDGVSFNVIATSSQLRQLFEAAGCRSLPASTRSVRDTIIAYANEVKSGYAEQFLKLKKNSESFSLSLDEWTSTGNKRYLNINVHSTSCFWNLGLVRIKGKFDSEYCKMAIQTRLAEFGISLDDIICLVTDGAAVMKKLGRICQKQQQLCFAHGLHLGVLDVLYNADIFESEEATANEVVEDLDDSDENASQFLFDDQDEINISVDYEAVILKVRKVCKLFKRSSKNADILESYAKEASRTTTTVSLDTKTRWNSVLEMLQKVHILKSEIQKSLIDINANVELEDRDYEAIKELVHALAPVKAAMDRICSREASLITCDAALTFMFRKLGQLQTVFGVRLREALLTRVKDRRTNMSDVLAYLNNANFLSQGMFADEETFFAKVGRKTMESNLKDLAKSIIADDGCNSTLDPQTPSLVLVTAENAMSSLDEEMDLFIKQAAAPVSGRGLSMSNDSALLRTVRKEMALHEDGGNRGKILQQLYGALLTIPPTSAEAERVFSIANSFCTKVRSCLGDDVLSALVLLKSYFKSTNP